MHGGRRVKFHRSRNNDRSGATRLASVRLTAEERRLIAESQAELGASWEGRPARKSGRRLEMRAEILRALCLEKPGDFWMRGARVTGQLDLAGMRLNHSLRFIDCEFTEIDLTGALAAEGIRLQGCKMRSLRADWLSVQGDLVLERVRNHGLVSLIGGRVGGSLRCTGSEFVNPGGRAFDGRDLSVEGSALFDGEFRSEGEVLLASARIKGLLSFRTASCRNAGARSIDATHLSLDGELSCGGGFRSEGEVCLRWAQVGAVHAQGGFFFNPELEFRSFG